MPQTKRPATGRDKLIQQRKAAKAENHERIRKALADAGEPLTASEIAQRVGLNPATVSEAASELGLYRRKAAHSERGGSLMGANPFIYWPERNVPKRKTPIEGATPPAKSVLPAPSALPVQRARGYEPVRHLADGRVLLTDPNDELWVAHRVEI